MSRERLKRRPRKSLSTDARHRGGAARSSEEGSVMGLERRGCIVRPYASGTTSNGRILLDKAKPFSISKAIVWEAYQRVKANGGAAGVDRHSIADFQVNLKDILYKLLY